MELDEDFNDLILRYTLTYLIPPLNTIKEKFINKMPLNSFDENLLYVIDNLLMIYTIETCLTWNPN